MKFYVLHLVSRKHSLGVYGNCIKIIWNLVILEIKINEPYYYGEWKKHGKIYKKSNLLYMQSQIDLIQKLNISPPKVIKFCKYFNGIFNGIFAYWVAQMVKYLPAIWRLGFDPWVGKTPRKRTWQPTPVFLPGKFYGQRSLVG